MAVHGASLAACTVIAVDDDHNHIRDVDGHGSVALPEQSDAETWLERIERIEPIERFERALGLPHKGAQR
ncbi:hypothetical protein [Cupriavidus pauculus]|uniref:hypothetical protein n=1 Tax=Cupriavidus pauculus TaxID=82633 RepID=UPI001EE27F89|nr:hypothetical protein [Cupriavidus pauculus]GJG97329.1 hypothetical protein CBA19C6_22590 [Cupriavidus pauculus]